ncbi:hypothetical protein [Xanthobacter oligotrophicus]|uniref:hypothetical protein n=1 Tax=Xanthobacter oligotrophicus TaxID=2607286 RepID=UPI0011F1A4DC|nr:hypothetical protein [Xanthobacter oligotrophicus]MCG5234556.1 hypothetical protein [Xanthobacter oligotrophicus]
MQLSRVPQLAAALLLATLAAGPVEAQARPDTLALSCQDAADLVTKSGAIVLGTGPNIYDRYVSQIRFCSGAEQLKAEWVKTRDNPQCFVGYTCYVPSRDNGVGR